MRENFIGFKNTFSYFKDEKDLILSIIYVCIECNVRIFIALVFNLIKLLPTLFFLQLFLFQFAVSDNAKVHSCTS